MVASTPEVNLIRIAVFDMMRVLLTQLLEARALYDKHYALEKKEIDLESKETSSGKKATNIPKATSCVMYAEKPKGSRLFAKIKNYR